MSQFDQITYLMLEANSQCNLHCTVCNRDRLVDLGWRDGKLMTEPELLHILEQCRELPINMIKFEGLSEPMLHPYFDRLAGILRNFFPYAQVIIATNLQYNIEKTPFFSTLPFVDTVYCSIDGTGALYEQVRKGGRWERIIGNLDIIGSSLTGSEQLKKLWFNFTATLLNYRCLPELYDLASRYGLSGVRINLAQNWNHDRPSSDKFSNEMLDFLKGYTKDLKGVVPWSYKDCFWPFAGVVIDVFGDVRQCVLKTSIPTIGNVFTSSLRSIFEESDIYRKTRACLCLDDQGPFCDYCAYSELVPTLAKVFQGSSPAKSRPFVVAENGR